MAAVGHFGCPKFTFDGISGHFRSIQNFFFEIFYRLPSAILDVRNSLSMAFLAISDQCKTFFYKSFIFYKMAASAILDVGTFDRISGHFRSICNLFFFGIF